MFADRSDSVPLPGYRFAVRTLELVDPTSPRVLELWGGLACRSYFLSPGWIENWLACVPARAAPQLAVIHDDGRPIAAAFLASRRRVRHGVIASRTMFLNTTGVPRLDELWIEYNGLAGDDLALDDLIRLLPGGWDELELPGLRADALGGVTDAERPGYRVRIERRVPAYHVALAEVRDRGYPALLSGQTRSQLRRAQRLVGERTLEVAADPAQALSIYDELCALHGAQWRAKGQPGAFADPWFDRFHRRLIARRFAAGEIQLARVRAGSETLGCLYNLVWRGRVLQYQSGMRTFDDARIKPGFVCHAAAIEHGAAAGLDVYDLLGGEMRYKKSLSTGADWLVWARVQRRRLRFAIEDRALALVRARRGVAAPHDAA